MEGLDVHISVNKSNEGINHQRTHCRNSGILEALDTSHLKETFHVLHGTTTSRNFSTCKTSKPLRVLHLSSDSCTIMRQTLTWKTLCLYLPYDWQYPNQCLNCKQKGILWHLNQPSPNKIK